jgi:hypothetical protein
MARVFTVRVHITRRIRVSRYKFYRGQVTGHVTQSFTESTGAAGLQPNQMAVKVPEIDCKNRDKPINFIFRFMPRHYSISINKIFSNKTRSKICEQFKVVTD